jgi:hypothetical protein
VGLTNWLAYNDSFELVIRPKGVAGIIKGGSAIWRILDGKRRVFAASRLRGSPTAGG